MATVAAMVVAMVAAMVVAMVDVLGLLWLMSWDCYGCYHGMTMVAAMGLLWLLLWLLSWESGVIIMTIAMVERSDNDSDDRAK